VQQLVVSYCGADETVVDGPFTIGRIGDLPIDDNPYLHRTFLRIEESGGFWWLTNVGSQLSATVSDGAGAVRAWLAPGATLPLVFEQTTVRFSAGPTSYEIDMSLERPAFSVRAEDVDDVGETTVGPPVLTRDQKLLLVAFAEPVLRDGGRGSGSVLTSADAAKRLGWTLTKLNRKLDNVCQKLARNGVRGLHGAPGELASSRRARLVEYAVEARLVKVDDLAMLDG
jgi:hypothetical protein